MKLSVGLKVANSLSLTPQLQQAIRLLQLSSLELEQEIQIHRVRLRRPGRRHQGPQPAGRGGAIRQRRAGASR